MNNEDTLYETMISFNLDQGPVILAPQNETTVATMLTLAFSSLGIALSGIALALLFTTAILFAEWRQNYKNQLLVQFITARFIYVLLRYFNNVRDVFGLYEIDQSAVVFKLFFLMYTEIAFVFWMLAFSKQLYISMVKVFYVKESYILRDSLVTWGLPVILAGITSYSIYKLEDVYITIHCIYFFILKWPLLVANAILISISLRTVLKTNTKVKNHRRIMFVMIVLIFSFCFQQFFMDIYKIVYVALLKMRHTTSVAVSGTSVGFNIFALYQCAASTVFWLFGNAKTRELWKFIPKNQRVISQLSYEYNVRNSTKL